MTLGHETKNVKLSHFWLENECWNVRASENRMLHRKGRIPRDFLFIHLDPEAVEGVQTKYSHLKVTTFLPRYICGTL